jgi:hypothetical protein
MFGRRAFLGQVPIVRLGQGKPAYPVKYPDSSDIYNRRKAQYKEAIEAGDEEMARFYQYQAEEMLEDYYIPGASAEDFSPTPSWPPKYWRSGTYSTPRRPAPSALEPWELEPTPKPTPTPSRPRNIPQGSYEPTPTPRTTYREQGMTPTCPSGQFVNPNYPERGCQPLGGGGLPGFPMDATASVSPMQLAPMSTYSSYMGRAMLGQVRLVKRGF